MTPAVRAAALLGLAVLLAAPPVAAAQERPAPEPPAQDPASRQIDALALRVDRFTLVNGLRVVVHTDRKAPVVSICVRYAVGAKHERADRHGFAHLFEHLMFSGSQNAPGDYFRHARALGGVGVNGHTGYDDTVFYETVPTASLDRALFLEADRMGHMADAIDQATLDINRGIVQNEKRQTENQPAGRLGDHVAARLFPGGHPHGHSVLGAMATLDAATVADVRDWHRRYYTPNNAVLVLAGDVDAATARRLVERRFGALARGPVVTPPAVPVAPLAAPIAETLPERVPAIGVTRHWIVPGRDRPDGLALDMAAKTLGTLSNAWLDEVLVRRERLVSSLIVSSGASADIGTFIINYSVAAGVDPERVATRLDALLAEFFRRGPDAADIRRVAMREVGWQTLSLETSIGQAQSLSEGVAAGDDPLRFRDRLRTMATLDPAAVRDAARRWLSRPAYVLTAVPGTPPAYVEAVPRPAAVPAPRDSRPPAPLPPIGPASPLRFPDVARARLRNGITLVHARRAGVPVTRLALVLDAGAAADPVTRPGAQDLLLALLPEGTATRDAGAIAAMRDALAADWFFEAGGDRTSGTLTVPTGSVDAALPLFADLVRHPRLEADAIARQRGLAIERLEMQRTIPDYLVERAAAPRLYGAASPYARAAAVTPAALAAITRDDLVALHRAWFRPDKTTLFVVSDLPLARVRAMLDAAFGDWRGHGAPGRKPPVAVHPAPPRVTVIDRPGSPQSVILAALPVAIDPHTDLLGLRVANEALGGFRGRINLDLRERNGWSYGASGGFRQRDRAITYIVQAPVQADRTVQAMASIRRNIAGIAGAEPMTPAEFGAAIAVQRTGLAGRFERGDAVLDAMRTNDALGRPDRHLATLDQRLAALTRESLNDAVNRAFDASRLQWIVAGDAARITADLAGMDMPAIELAPIGSP